jgi:predicted enzyme related to lactoylglutathione lyase
MHMANLHGDFIWYELMTPDPAGAKAFYDVVIGWSMAGEGNAMPGGAEYREVMAQDGNHAGGVLTLTPQMAEAGTQPAWIGYIGVDDVDATVSKAQEHGGTVFMGPMDMEGVGRMAMLADPQGVPFYVMRGFPGGESKAYQMMSPGHVAWNELNTGEPEAARTFYYELFGWTDGEAMPMGELGTYQMFDQNGQTIGAMMRLIRDSMPSPSWLFYFAVEDIDEAHRAISASGGQVLQEPQEIPGGMFSLSARDPQGAMFAIVGPRKA